MLQADLHRNPVRITAKLQKLQSNIKNRPFATIRPPFCMILRADSEKHTLSINLWNRVISTSILVDSDLDRHRLGSTSIWIDIDLNQGRLSSESTLIKVEFIKKGGEAKQQVQPEVPQARSCSWLLSARHTQWRPKASWGGGMSAPRRGGSERSEGKGQKPVELAV